MKDWVATSIVNKGLPGMNKGQCGVIVDPSAVEVQCSYYADMTSWSTGCDAEFLATERLARPVGGFKCAGDAASSTSWWT